MLIPRHIMPSSMAFFSSCLVCIATGEPALSITVNTRCLRICCMHVADGFVGTSVVSAHASPYLCTDYSNCRASMREVLLMANSDWQHSR